MMMSNAASIKEGEFIQSATRTLVDDLLTKGEFDEARKVLRGRIAELGPDEVDEFAACKCALAKTERQAKNYAEALRIYNEIHALSELCAHAVRAKYRLGLATLYEELGTPEYLDRALIEYEASRFHYEESGDRAGVGYVENNMAVLSCDLGRMVEACEHVRRARTCFEGQEVRLAQIDDTDALIRLKEGNPAEALPFILSATYTFIEHGETRLLNESIPTLIKAAVDYQHEQGK